MDIGRIPLFEALAKRMAWLTQRQTVLAENVANANTPGYVSKDIKELDFGSAISQAQGALRLAVTQPGHIVSSTPDTVAPVVADPDEGSIDGNGVSLESQMMKVSTNASDFALVTTLYKQNVAMVKSVLGGSGG